MAIRCVCPKGHVLKVKEKLAGTQGLCPVCRSPVKVPTLRDKKVSEDAVIAILGPFDLTDSKDTTPVEVAEENEVKSLQETIQSGLFGRGTIVKNCTRCNQEIAAGSHVCPHCHTYIAQARDF
jgi:hypothetical protein